MNESIKAQKIGHGNPNAGKSDFPTCPICLENLFKPVRDHDHATGFIRGVICEHCNCWLGILENHPESYYLRKKPGRRKWRKWVYKNAERIREHLEKNTGVQYTRKVSKVGCDAVRDHLETGHAPVTTTRTGPDESRTKTRSNNPPKTDDPTLERLEWARSLIAKARGGWA